MADERQLKALVESRHESYDANHWNMLWNSYSGGKAFCSSEYVHRHKKEEESIYAGRLARLYYLNYVKPLNQLVVDYIFQDDSVNRSNSEDQFLNNVDRCGTPVNSFIKRAALYAIVEGMAYIIVDAPIPTIEPRSREEERNQKLSPYWVLLHRKDVLNWELDENGNPLWALVRESAEPVGDPFAIGDQKKRRYFKLWTRDAWYRIAGDVSTIGMQSKLDKIVIESEGPNNRGVVPIVPLYGDYVDNWIGASWNEDIALIAKAILNTCSMRDDYNYECALEQIVFPGDAEEIADIIKGNAWAIALGSQERAFEPYSLSYTGNAAAILATQINDLRDGLYHIARQRILNTSAQSDGASGESKKEDFKATQSNLASLAQECERVENKLHELSAMSGGSPNNATYPNSFDTESIERAIDQLLRLQTTDAPDKLLEFQLKRIAKLIVGPNGKSQELSEIIDAIEQMSSMKDEMSNQEQNTVVDMIGARTDDATQQQSGQQTGEAINQMQS